MIDLLLVEEEGLFNESESLVDQILVTNKDSESLRALYIQAKSVTLGEYTLKNRLLLFTSQLIVLATLNNLCIELI